MAETIYKYQIPLEDVFETELPEAASVLHFDDQDGNLTVWVRLDPEAPKVVWRFHLRGTGHPLPEGLSLQYIGTCQHAGRFVWHLFRDLGSLNPTPNRVGNN